MGHISNAKDFFRGIATNFKPLGHTEEKPKFFSLSVEQIIDAARRDLNISDWFMTMVTFEPVLKKLPSRQYRYEIKVAIEIVKDIAGNESEKDIVQDEAFALCEEIVAHIQNLAAARNFPLGELLDETIDYYEVNNTFDSCAGYGFEINYLVTYNRQEKINSNNWN
ncbi:MAG: hypothetical protein ACOVOV_04615 [Dolichospermum sp.]